MKLCFILITPLLIANSSHASATDSEISMLAALNNESCVIDFNGANQFDLVYPLVSLPLVDGDVLGKNDVHVGFGNCPAHIPVTMTLRSTMLNSHTDMVKNVGTAKGVYLKAIYESGSSMSITPHGESQPLIKSTPFEINRDYDIYRTLPKFASFNFSPVVYVGKIETGEEPGAGHYYFPIDFVVRFN